MGGLKSWLMIGLAMWLNACATMPEPAAEPAKPLVVLISIDGFRADYVERGMTPNLKALMAQGATAPMRPSFPSLTFPNHYTLVTGLRPDHHGIVGNTMRDAQRPGETFRLSNKAAVTDGFWWNDAKPFWVSAREQGMIVATQFWPGSEAEIHRVRPNFYVPFEDHLPPVTVVERGLKLLDLPGSERPQALTVYFSDVDHAGHDFGPDGPEVDASLSAVDQAIGVLIDGLKARGLWGQAHLIIVGDHGMAAHRAETFVKLADLMPADLYELVPSGQIAGFNYKPGREAELDAVLLKPHDHMTCWRKGEIPARFHFGSHRRVAAIVCLANPGSYIVSPSRDSWMPKPQGGSHGYDPYEPRMWSRLIVVGPEIKAGVTLETIDNVDVYPLMMHLLRLKAEPSDGQLKNLEPVLTSKPQ